MSIKSALEIESNPDPIKDDKDFAEFEKLWDRAERRRKVAAEREELDEMYASGEISQQYYLNHIGEGKTGS